MKQILTILKTNLKRKSLLLLNVLIRPFRKRKVRRMLHRIWNLAMMKRILARKKQQKKLQAPQKKHRLLRIVKFLRRKKAK